MHFSLLKNKLLTDWPLAGSVRHCCGWVCEALLQADSQTAGSRHVERDINELMPAEFSPPACHRACSALTGLVHVT